MESAFNRRYLGGRANRVRAADTWGFPSSAEHVENNRGVGKSDNYLGYVRLNLSTVSICEPGLLGADKRI